MIYVTSKRTCFLFEILLKIGSIEEITASGNKEVPQTFSTIPFICENTF